MDNPMNRAASRSPWRWVAAPILLALCAGCPAVPGNGGGQCVGDAAGETASDFFVAGSFGNDANLGGKNDPFATIQAAIERAADSGGGNVHVAGGVYNQSITVRSNVNLLGGFDRASWVQCPTVSPTTIVGGPTAVNGDGVESLTINGFTIGNLRKLLFGGGLMVAVRFSVWLDSWRLLPLVLS